MIFEIDNTYSPHDAKKDLSFALKSNNTFVLRFPNNNIMSFSGMKNKNIKYKVFQDVPSEITLKEVLKRKPLKGGTYQTFTKDDDINASEAVKHLLSSSGWDPNTRTIPSLLAGGEKEDKINHINNKGLL